MPYRIDPGGAVPDALRRVLVERLDTAAARLGDDYAGDPVEAVHKARTDLKKARSALRLARADMPSSAYRHADGALRDRGRALSTARDADVAVATLDALAARFAGQLPESAFSGVRARLALDAAGAQEAAGLAVAGNADDLRRLAREAEGWKLDRCDGDTIARGLARTYARGRGTLVAAEREPSDERFHEWRKRVKDLWYQTRLLRPAWPGMLGAYADEARALSRSLGDEHDLAVLAAALGPGEEEIAALIPPRHEELRAAAAGLGRRLYAERTRAFARRTRAILRTAAEDAEAAAVSGRSPA
jgi:CHAD domain-containing protein